MSNLRKKKLQHIGQVRYACISIVGVDAPVLATSVAAVPTHAFVERQKGANGAPTRHTCMHRRVCARIVHIRIHACRQPHTRRLCLTRNFGCAPALSPVAFLSLLRCAGGELCGTGRMGVSSLALFSVRNRPNAWRRFILQSEAGYRRVYRREGARVDFASLYRERKTFFFFFFFFLVFFTLARCGCAAAMLCCATFFVFRYLNCSAVYLTCRMFVNSLPSRLWTGRLWTMLTTRPNVWIGKCLPPPPHRQSAVSSPLCFFSSFFVSRRLLLLALLALDLLLVWSSS